MWGVLIAGVIYGIAIILNIGREGLQEYYSHSVWTSEEVERVKKASVFGWRLFVAISAIAGIVLLGYVFLHKVPEEEQLLKREGIVTNITESGSGDREIHLKKEGDFVITNRIKSLLAEEELEKCRQQERSVEVLFQSQKQFLNGTKKTVYGLKAEGEVLLSYGKAKAAEEKMQNIWIQISYGMFTVAGISVFLLLYAKKNPKVYKIICLMKGEKGIKPTVSQKIEQHIDKMLSSDNRSKKPEINAGYYGKYHKKLKNEANKKQDK